MTILFDAQDLALFKKYKWNLHKSKSKFYLRCRHNEKYIYFHKLLCNSAEVDHINGNGLDNRRSNLRPCTRTQNNANRFDDGTKGVHFDKQSGKYRAQIECNGVRYRLGRFSNFIDAKNAYNNKAKELFGDFANVREASMSIRSDKDP